MAMDLARKIQTVLLPENQHIGDYDVAAMMALVKISRITTSPGQADHWIDLAGYEPAPLTFDPPTIGYLSRMAQSLGLGLLVEAFLELRRDPELGDLRRAVHAAAMAPGDDLWLVGRPGIAARWNGTTWSALGTDLVEPPEEF